jgi:polysaccharide export outer membrane protein
MGKEETLRSAVRIRALRVWAGGGFALCLTCGFLIGCAFRGRPPDLAAKFDPTLPREQTRISFPPYRVAPPDILLIEAVTNIRPAQTKLQVGDQVLVRLENGLPMEPGADATQDPLQLEAKRQTELQFKIINGPYTITPNGSIDLGPAYGQVKIAGLTVEQAKTVIARYLHDRIGLSEPKLSVVLADMSGKQAVAGQHLVRPDGTVSLGIYGDVHLSGMTLAEARFVLEQYLANFLEKPQVSVDVLSYNSKVYYICMDGGGYGVQVIRLPCTGNETVLDAMAQVQGLSQVSSKQMWIARPCEDKPGQSRILCVNWDAITAGGITTTNYQIFPGDRIYVRADQMIATDNYLSKYLTPIERVMGFTLLGVGTVGRLQFYHESASSGGAI